MARPTTRTTQNEQATELYEQLKPEAQAVYLDHIMSRTPAELQDEMRVIVTADLAAPEDPTTAMVSNGQSVVVNDSTGAAQPGSPGTAAVANGTLTAVALGPIAQRAGMQQGPPNQRR